MLLRLREPGNTLAVVAQLAEALSHTSKGLRFNPGLGARRPISISLPPFLPLSLKLIETYPWTNIKNQLGN